MRSSEQFTPINHFLKTYSRSVSSHYPLTFSFYDSIYCGLFLQNHARGKTTVVPPPRPPRLSSSSNKITVNPPLPDKPIHVSSPDEAKVIDSQIDNKELKHEIKIEEAQIFQRLKFPLFLQLSLIHLKLLILKDELQFAIDTKAFQKAKEITAENKLWSQWRENLLLSLEDLPRFSEDLNVVKFDVLEQLESHFRNCLEKDESEDLLAGIDSFRTELINVIEESIFNQRQNMPLRLSEHVTTSPISHSDPSIFTYPLPPNKFTHVFLTHTWRRDEEGRDNHMRVARINEALKKRGIITWFDSDRMSGTIRSTMTKALYSTCCVLIFITREYEKKVNLDDESDNCYFEFKVVSEDHQLVNMRIPVVMEKSMTNPNEWNRGILKAELGGKLFFDMSSDKEEEIETRCDEIVGRMMELLKGKYPTYY